jgi:hypothetical protein
MSKVDEKIREMKEDSDADIIEEYNNEDERWKLEEL